MKIKDYISKYTYLRDFFEAFNLDIDLIEELTINDFLSKFDDDFYFDRSINKETFLDELNDYINLMNIYQEDAIQSIKLTLLPGITKSKDKETFDLFEVNQGEIIAIVGPTGSGKSRLLADIEWAANADTPTKRKVLINDKPVDFKERFSVSNKLVAQLSQNMNFVMDMTVQEFLELHCASRLVNNISEVIKVIYEQAITLAGEKFELSTPITSLSGGQSRALMISDTAYLSKSPIILIDEIENAGIDRRKALELLVSNDKIVFMSTHDPILALMADKRIVISNGGISTIITTSDEEKNILVELEELDKKMVQYRQMLRYGKTIK